MIRVLYPFSGDSVGGAQISSIELISCLTKYNIEPVIFLHSNGPLAQYLRSRQINFIIGEKIPLAQNRALFFEIVRMLLSALLVARFLVKNKIDVVHTNDGTMHKTWLVGSKVAKIKFVWHQRSYDNSRRIGLYALLANRVITISEYCRSGLSKTILPRTLLIYDFFPLLTAEPNPVLKRAEIVRLSAQPGEVKIIGYVANITEQKRPFKFLEIASDLKKSTSQPLIFVMIGSYNEEMLAQLKEAKLNFGLGPEVMFLGPKTEISSWIAAFDVLVAPAKNEGLGRTLIEAIQVGTPVVASDHGGHREILEKNCMGVLIDPDDTGAFSTSILKQLDDKNLSRKSMAQAKCNIEKKFSQPKLVKDIFDVYQALFLSS